MQITILLFIQKRLNADGKGLQPLREKLCCKTSHFQNFIVKKILYQLFIVVHNLSANRESKSDQTMVIARQVSFPPKRIIAYQRKRGRTGWIQQHNRKEDLNLQKQRGLSKKSRGYKRGHVAPDCCLKKTLSLPSGRVKTIKLQVTKCFWQINFVWRSVGGAPPFLFSFYN